MGDLLPYGGRERRITKPSPLFLALAGAGVLGIVYATLCPIGLRPHFASANLERFGAYFGLGGLLALAFPRRRLWVIATVTLLAVGLEMGQLLVPGRDGRVSDAAVKALGGLTGAGVGYLVFPVRRLIRALLTAPSDQSAKLPLP